MNKLLIAVSICTCATAFAQAGKSEKTPPPGKPTAPSGASAAPEMTPPKPGPDQEALKPFVHNGSYTGTSVMGEGKEVPTKGKQTCKWINGGMWATCDVEMTSGTGKQAVKWMGHIVMGYDTVAKGYRSVVTDNFGMIDRMKGTLEAPGKMVWESMEETKVPGMPSKSRITDDASEPKVEKMTFEGWMNGKWVPMGSGSFKTSK